jgi:hypothetical protein
MKICKKCGHTKEAADFYKGQACCKVCRCAQVRRHRMENLDRIQAYDRRRFQEDPKRRSDTLISARATTARHKLKKWCRSATQDAIDSGTLIRLPCEKCGSFPVEAHHTDYSKPLQVKWLCRAHHMEHHRKYQHEYEQYSKSKEGSA